MEEPQPLINPPMEIEIQQESPQLIPEIQPQVEPEPLQPDNQPNEPNEPDNIVLETVNNEVEPIQEEPKPEAMETEPEQPKEHLNLVEELISQISAEKENILPDEPYTNEEIDKPEEIMELPQSEPIKSQNAITSLDDIPEDLKDQEVKKSLIEEGDDVDYEEAIRELDELFNSGEDTTKDPITPPKESAEGEPEEKENDIKIKIRPGSKSQTIDFASQPSGSGSKKGKESPVSVNEKNSQQQRGRKKRTKLTESNPFVEEIEEILDSTAKLFKLTHDKKFMVPNKNLDVEELKQRYHNIIYNFRSESEVACLVCLDDESAPEDDIIICDLCSSAFHQSCYGSDLLSIAQDDDSEWHCQRCAFLLKNNLPPEGIMCMFCPELKGPMKRVRNTNSHEWAHIVCVNWIPEIYYQEEREKANVYITEYKAKKHCGRKYLDCDFCHLGYGDCIDCDNDKCKRAFHVTCAQKHGLICNWKEMKDMKRDQDTEFYTPIYCKHHMQLYSQAMFDFSNKVEARNEGRGLEVSLLLDPSTIAKSQAPKRSHQKKKRLPELERSEEKEYDPDATIKSYSPDGEPSKRKSRRTRQQIEEEEERRAFKTRGRTAKKSVVSQEDDTPDKMRESNPDSERKFEVEAHYEEKPRREHPGSKKEMDSSFISTGRVMSQMTYTTMEEEGPESKKSTPVKSKKLGGGPVTEHKAEPKHNVIHKKEKTEKKEKKKEKMEHIEKSNKRDRPDKTAKEEQAEKKEHSGPALYKFRPNMAKLLMFNGWGTEKEIKTVISDYIKTKGLYRKDDEEIDVTRDKGLEDIMGLERISRKQIFNEFLHFMLKKTPEEIVRDDNDAPFVSLYEEEYKKAKEKDRHGKENSKMHVEEKQGEQKIKKKPAFSNTTKKEPVKEATRPLAQSQTAAKAKNTLTQNTASKPIERPFQQIFGKESMAMGWQPSTRDPVVKPKPQEKESDLDFFEWAPKHNENKPTTHHTNIAKPIHSSQPIQKSSHVISVEEEKEPPILKRMKINTPPKTNSTVFSSLFASKETKETKEDRQNTNKEDRHNTNKEERYITPAQPAVVVRSKKNDPYEDLGPLINRVDKMPFRRNMNWFVKTDSSLAVSSINSQTARERFWPKGANQLF